MFFALSTFLWTPRFEARHLPLLPTIKALGADAVEIQRSGFDDFPVEEIRRELDRLGLSCTLSASPLDPDACVIADDSGARRAGVAYLRDAIHVARDLGASALVGPLYAPVWWFSGARPSAEQYDRAAEGFAQLADSLDSAGIDMAIEPLNRFETFFLNTAAQGVALCETIDNARIGLLLDTAHMAIEEKDISAAIRRAGGWLRHLQLPENDRGTPGTGMIDWPALFDAIEDIGYAGGCSIESFPFSAPELAMRTRTWRDLAASPETLGSEGLAFLRASHAAAKARRA